MGDGVLSDGVLGVCEVITGDRDGNTLHLVESCQGGDRCNLIGRRDASPLTSQCRVAVAHHEPQVPVPSHSWPQLRHDAGDAVEVSKKHGRQLPLAEPSRGVAVNNVNAQGVDLALGDPR